MISIMKNPNLMIDRSNVMSARPAAPPKVDRLAIFFRVFRLEVMVMEPEAVAGAEAALFLTADARGEAQSIVLALAGHTAPPPAGTIVAARVSFGSGGNPLMQALPARFVVALSNLPVLRDTARAFAAEAAAIRCGRHAALDRLGEVIVLMVLRQAIDVGTTGPGLIAGLAHPCLHRALVAMHDEPARQWRVDDLAASAGLSRSGFMTLFRSVVGTTPMSYLTRWRLTTGRRDLLRGDAVKAVARRAGFGSAEAFSRAYSRAFGHPPNAAALHLASEPPAVADILKE
jgi:AraC-like DNA-binding protein